MEKLLTVVIPAYNAEAYLAYTLDSLCGAFQSNRTAGKTGDAERQNLLEKLEILVIDDGSKDETGKIADGYAGQYPEIVRVIHKENGGHGSGINCGIREARGRYLKVVDADDWVDPEAFLNLLAALENSQDDAVVSGFYWRFDNGSGDHIPLIT